MPECIFCKIAKGEIPAEKIYEDKDFLAFLDIMPSSKGHTLVIPKRHFQTIEDIPENELKGLIAAVKKVATAVMKATNSPGANIFQNNSEFAGQIVPHIHFHIIPRNKDDKVSISVSHIEYESGEISAYSERIRKALL
ncbi:MAG: HIT family protein [Candidatus Woesearchaeota archaeon]|nr:HIT family protein [Candidatus Woesearchaeota archaeon]